MQRNEDTKYSAICYCSRTLSSTERRWPPVKVELGAIIFALRSFRPYIFNSEVELHTDHKPLKYLLKKADAHPNLARWLIELQNYRINIVHIAGKENFYNAVNRQHRPFELLALQIRIKFHFFNRVNNRHRIYEPLPQRHRTQSERRHYVKDRLDKKK